MPFLSRNAPIRITLFSFTIWILFLGSTKSLTAQLQGNYTIGGSGSNNFSSWSRFADSLNKNGVSGKVEITVKADLTENSVIQLKQHTRYPITKTNSLHIKGGGYTLKGNQNKEILHLEGIDHVAMSALILENTHQKGRAAGIRLSNQADSNTIDSCTVLLGNMQVDRTDSSAYIVFAVDTTMTRSTTLNNGSYNTVSNCVFKTKGGGGPRFAVIDQQSRSTYTTSPNKNIFKNNRIQNFYSGVFLLRFVNGEVVENNKIDRIDAKSTDAVDTAMVLFQVQNVRNTTKATLIKGNICENLPYSGAYTAAASELIRLTAVNLFNTSGNDSVYVQIEENVFRNFRMKQEFVGINSRRNQCFSIGGNLFNAVVSDKATAYGISVFNSKDFRVERNKFYNTTFSLNAKDYVWFIYMYENENSRGKRNTISDNVIDSNQSYSLTGIWFYGLCDYDIRRNQIVNNRIISEGYSAFIGLETQGVGNVDVVSNLIANNHCKGQMLMWYSDNNTSGSIYNAYYNTISMEDSFSAYSYHYLSFFWDQSEVNFVGNVIKAKGNSTSELLVTLFNRIGILEENNFYIEGNFAMENWFVDAATVYNDFFSWSQDVSVPASNFLADPKFYKPRKVDFRCGSTKNQNTTKAYKFSDFDVYGKKRNGGFHDLGAVEDRFDLSLKIANITLADTVCSGYELTPECWVTNHFWDTVKSFSLSVGANGSWTKETYTKTILPGDSVKVSLSAPVRLNNTGASVLRLALNTPNDFLQNDTVTFRTFVKTAPGGSGFASVVPTTGNKPVFSINTALDKTIKNLEIGYKVGRPRNKIQADYGITWTASTQAYSISGKVLTGASIVAPTASDSLKWVFVTSDSLLDDSTLIWQLKISDLSNGCDTVYTRMLYISPTPTVDFSVKQGLCNGDTLRFVNTTSVASNRVFLYYSWNFGTGRAGDTSDLFEPQFKYDSAGLYPVKLEIVSMPDNFIFGVEKQFDIKARPKVAFDRDNACDGLPVNFTNKSTPSASKMTWNFGKSDTVISQAKFQHRFLGAGSYWVRLTAALGECAQSESIRIVVYEQPKAQFDLASGSCQYDKFSFTNKTVMNTSLFGSLWNFDEADNRATDRSPNYTYQTSGTKRVGLRIRSEFGCVDSTTRTVQVKAAPVASIEVTDTCNLRVGKIFNATPEVAGVVRSLSWELEGKARGGADTLSEAWIGTGNYAIRLRVDFDNGCFDEAQRTISVLRELKPDFTFENACSGDTMYFKNTTIYESGDQVSWYWDFADGTESSDFEKNHAFITDKTKTLNVMLRSTLNGACVSQFVKPVTVWESPRTCEFIGDPDYEKAFYGLKFEPAADGIRGGQNNVRYQWFLKGYVEQTSSGTNAAVVYALSEDGEYEMRMVATTEDHGCSCMAKGMVKLDRLQTESLWTQVTVYPNPSSGTFMLRSSGAGALDVQVYGLNGSLWWQKTNVRDGDEMDFSHFSGGNYILRLSDESGMVANQMITIAR